MFCPKCSNILKKTDKYCPNCGTEQENPPTTLSSEANITKAISKKTSRFLPHAFLISLGIIFALVGAYLFIEKRQSAIAEVEHMQADTLKLKHQNDRLRAEIEGISSDTPDTIVIDMCHERLQQLAKYQSEVISTNVDRLAGKGITIVTGDVKYQNGFGAWDRKTYRCHMAAPHDIYVNLDGELLGTFNTLLDK